MYILNNKANGRQIGRSLGLSRRSFIPEGYADIVHEIYWYSMKRHVLYYEYALIKLCRRGDESAVLDNRFSS